MQDNATYIKRFCEPSRRGASVRETLPASSARDNLFSSGGSNSDNSVSAMGESEKPWRNEELLYELHREKEMSPPEIADELGCSSPTVRNWLDKHGIERRPTKPQLGSEPWHDEDTLREMHHDEQKMPKEIAEEFNTRPATIRKWLNRYDIERRNYNTNNPTGKRPWDDPDLLNELYWEKGHTTAEMAEMLNCDKSTIRLMMDKYDIERRSFGGSERVEYAQFRTNNYGHETWRATIEPYYQTRFPVHRLLAIAEFGFEEVADKQVHHINGVPWDNRPENITLLSRSDHMRVHALERAGREDDAEEILDESEKSLRGGDAE